MERGLVLAFFAVILWGFLDASSRYAVVTLGADPWVFSCLNLMIGALILLAIAGPGQGGLETIRRAHTWVFGVFRVLMTLFLVFAFTAVSASEANFMLRINVLMGMLAAWLLFKRKPTLADVPGILMILGGFITIVVRQENAYLNWAVVLVLLAALCDTVLTVIAETHPNSRKASGLHARCRYTGFVLLVTSLFFFAIAGVMSVAKGTLAEVAVLAPLLNMAPSAADFMHPATWLAALVIGVLLRAPSMYMYLYAARLLKTENLMMAATLAPFATLAAESLFVFEGLVEASTLDGTDVLAGVAMTLGALSMVLVRAYRSRRALNVLTATDKGDF